MGDRELFHDVECVLAPGTKLGLLGPNGSGKSTLIKLIRGQLTPDAGQVVRADGLKLVVFDQHREQLDPQQTLRRALSPAGDSLVVRGQPMHVTGWARQFLFRNEQLDLPVGELSGGEQARVLIARLMLHEADVLILDEPTNDLDIPTLDVLETSLEEFPGALVLVTHDRYLLDRVSTSILALDGEGEAKAFANLEQWERWHASAGDRTGRAAKPQAATKPQAGSKPQAASQSAATSRSSAASQATVAAVVPAKKKTKLSWNEQKELDGMEAAIAKAEERVEGLTKRLDDPALLADHAKSRDAYALLGGAQADVERLYARWAELEAK